MDRIDGIGRFFPGARPSIGGGFPAGTLPSLLMILLPSVASGHGDHDEAPQQVLLMWKWDPLIMISLTVLGLLYASGCYRMFRKTTQNVVRKPHVIAYFSGLFALVIALLSPVDVLGADLFWMHMIQHMIIMTVAAPLMAAAAPDFVVIWALPLPWRKTLGKIKQRVDAWQSPWYLLWQPLVLWPLFAFILWIWHLPRFYEAALQDYWVHAFQHIGFFVIAFLFWRVLLDPISRLRLSTGMGILYLFATSMHAMLLGVFMTLSPRVWYPSHLLTTERWGVSALEDQQVAGLIMWMPACMIYVIVTGYIFFEWFQKSQVSGRLQ